MKFLVLLLSLTVGSAHAYTVHEWGTFTSLVGSDGSRQDGMVYEDEALPDFVHNFWDAATAPLMLTTVNTTPTRPRPCCVTKMPPEFLRSQIITQKMETPVLYFYSYTPRKVSVEVGFPTGIISQTFPAPVVSLPEAIPGVELINGFARFDVDVLTQTDLTPPLVEEGNIYAHARAVSANTIVSNNEVEKFIFYRGLGKFETDLLITSAQGGIKIENTGRGIVPKVFLVDTTGTTGAIMELGFLAGKPKFISGRAVESFRASHLEFDIFAEKARTLLTSALVENGLYNDEALAMVNTWEHGYFKTPGLRVLYILSSTEVESLLPMKITPAPRDFERVFVGRIEILRDTEEQVILHDILKAGRAYNVLSLGRFAPSIIKRIEVVAQNRGLLNEELKSVFAHYQKVIDENM
jgi:hypothetical protein